jgi:uncharacterized protein DUF3489
MGTPQKHPPPFLFPAASNSLAFPGDQSDESTCAERRAEKERETNMTNQEATNADTAATVAEQGAHVAPEKGTAKKGASQKKGAPNGQKAAKSGKTKAAAPKKAAKAGKKAAKPAPAKKAGTPRAESKTAKVLEMISRAKGATLAEIMKATTWQAHSVRGFISGALGKKMGLTVESTKNDNGERTYKLCGAPHNR